MTKKRRAQAIIFGSCFALTLAASVPVEAVFQNWQSRAFEPGEAQKEAQEQRSQDQRQSVREGRQLDFDESQANYYQEVAPQEMERDHNYLMENHPIQEAPLPTKSVE